MSLPSRLQICQLYKSLLRYGEQLKLTDKGYYYSRIKKEFKRNQSLQKPEDICRYYEVGFVFREMFRCTNHFFILERTVFPPEEEFGVR